MEVLYPHGSIIGGEHPQHLIPIDGMIKDKVHDIFDGKSEEHRKISIESKVKVSVMSFQDTPSSVATSTTKGKHCCNK